MKPLFGTLAFIGLTVLGVLIAGCLVTTPSFLNNVAYSIEIGDPHTNTYVELKDGVQVGEPKLRAALAKAKHNGGKCEITFLRKPPPHATPEPHYCDNIHASIKTARIIKSELASNRGHDSSSANDPNLMHRVQSPILNDITDVRKLLKQ
jgi:hypothetical protein